MTSSQNQEWLKEFAEFNNMKEIRVPQDLTEKVWDRMNQLIHPKPSMIFYKILGIHFVVGFLSLSFCHQFGMNPFQTSSSLADVFMQMGGHSFCMFACGALFMGTSLATAGFFLSLEEVKVLRKTELLQNLLLSGLSLGIFAMLGAELALTFAGLWLLGALIAGFLATEALWQLKKA